MVESLAQLLWPLPCPAFVAADYRGAKALEIGNASPSFAMRGIFPVYPELRQLDRIVKSSHTPWARQSGLIACTTTHTYIGCATICPGVPVGQYEVILSSHVLEHIANPLLALSTWYRLLPNGGRLVLLLPRHSHTHDWRRPRTSFAHLAEDWVRAAPESDRTHVEEYVRYYDHKMVTGPRPEEGDLEELAGQNYLTRIVHHHTWDMTLAKLAVAHVGFNLERWCHAAPFHIVIVARKTL